MIVYTLMNVNAKKTKPFENMNEHSFYESHSSSPRFRLAWLILRIGSSQMEDVALDIFKQFTHFLISDGEEELVEILSAAQPGLDVR